MKEKPKLNCLYLVADKLQSIDIVLRIDSLFMITFHLLYNSERAENRDYRDNEPAIHLLSWYVEFVMKCKK